jgi:hypothetical protein
MYLIRPAQIRMFFPEVYTAKDLIRMKNFHTLLHSDPSLVSYGGDIIKFTSFHPAE